MGTSRFFFRGDSTLIDERPGVHRWLRRRWLRWVYRHVDVALYVGSHNRQYFLAHGLMESQVAWAPHSVENERFADTNGRDYSGQAVHWRRTLGIADDERSVLFAGKLESKKAPDLLLEAFLRRQPAARGEHLIFVGTGPLESSLRQRAAGNARVHFLGFQNQSRMPVVYRLGDLFVLPSRGPGETWGLAINEAMACGRPVIVSDRVGCAPDLVEGRGTGTVFRSGSITCLGDSLAELLPDAQRLRLMGEAATSEIRRWSLENQAACILGSVAARVRIA